jgi:UDP-2-acetamido-2-deoxy-ribo-hexuluronate aminotransferase
MHQQKALAHLNYKKGDFPHAEKASDQVISLPFHPYMQISEQVKVVSAVKKALAESESLESQAV